MWPFRRREIAPSPPRRALSIFSTHLDIVGRSAAEIVAKAITRTAKQDFVGTHGADANEAVNSVKMPRLGASESIPANQLAYYASYGFIGYQACALIAQHWLVDKACHMPAKDAVRNGYEITVNDGTQVKPEVLDALRKADKRWRINHQMREFIGKGRIFGIRVAMFKVQSSDPDYYKKPFNIDGVTPGSYRGIVQIDPYWIAPILDMEAASDPTDGHFYEPTFWTINGIPVHRSHVIVFKTAEMPDVLAPTYFYGGIPVPQKIFERVYAAERIANEAPLLALTKRSTNYFTDLEQVGANQAMIEEKMGDWAYLRDNYGIKLADRDDRIEQHDTTLAELDAVIMTEYQLVCAAAEVPSTKLLGTSPKGFNATGEYDEASYHEMLDGIKENDLTPLLDRHHAMVIRSEIAPRFGIKPFNTSVAWNPSDAMTGNELAELNLNKARADEINVNIGALDGVDVRNRLITDPDSGYTGIKAEAPEPVDVEEDPEAEPDGAPQA